MVFQLLKWFLKRRLDAILDEIVQSIIILESIISELLTVLCLSLSLLALSYDVRQHFGNSATLVRRTLHV